MKEEEFRKRQAEWEAMDSQVKFYLTSEDPFKEPCIKFTEEGSSSLEVKLEGTELRQFESDINESRGCWVYFDKLPPPEGKRFKILNL
jgi:hypothetical protein